VAPTSDPLAGFGAGAVGTDTTDRAAPGDPPGEIDQIHHLKGITMDTDPDTTWDTAELQRDFEVLGFLAPYVVVRRRDDGRRGTLTFTHRPRLYYGWVADDE